MLNNLNSITGIILNYQYLFYIHVIWSFQGRWERCSLYVLACFLSATVQGGYA